MQNKNAKCKMEGKMKNEKGITENKKRKMKNEKMKNSTYNAAEHKDNLKFNSAISGNVTNAAISH
jgi:hypothetical protein